MRALLALLLACKPSGDPDGAKHLLGLEPDMAAAASAPVERETIEAPSGAGGDTGLWPNVLSDGQRLFIAYCDGHLGDVKLATRDGAWRVETVDQRGAVGKYLSAALGPSGPELVYLDQDRSVLRYAKRAGAGWAIEDVAKGKGEIGIAARLVLGPRGERTVLHYSAAFDLLLTQNSGSGWSTQTLERAVGTYQSLIGAFYDDGGVLHLSYPDQNIGDPGLRVATIDASGKLNNRGVLGRVAAQSEMLGNELLFLSNDDTLNAAPLRGLERDPATLVAKHVRGFRALVLRGQVLAIALIVGESDQVNGVGGGRLELAWRNGAQWQRVTVAPHSDAYFSMTERIASDGASIVEIAYYDEHALKHAAVRLLTPAPSGSR